MIVVIGMRIRLYLGCIFVDGILEVGVGLGGKRKKVLFCLEYLGI